MRDLVILAADSNAEFALRGLLGRTVSLGIRDIDAEVFVHPERDPGCLLRGHDFLRNFCRQFEHALLVLDREGCGQDGYTREELETNLEERLSSSGWGDRARALVIDPELEIWIWSPSPNVDRVLGWESSSQPLREWLRAQGILAPGSIKPSRPKDALTLALRESRTPRSSALYRAVTASVGLTHCTDPAFVKVKGVLKSWFPSQEAILAP